MALKCTRMSTNAEINTRQTLDISPLNEITCIHLDHGEPAASDRCNVVNLLTAEEEEEEEVGVSHRRTQTWLEDEVM